MNLLQNYPLPKFQKGANFATQPSTQKLNFNVNAITPQMRLFKFFFGSPFNLPSNPAIVATLNPKPNLYFEKTDEELAIERNGKKVRPIDRKIYISPTDTFHLADNRKINATSELPIKPNRDLFGGIYSKSMARYLVNEARLAKLSKEEAYDILAQSLQETTLGNRNPSNIGHVRFNGQGVSQEPLINAYIANKKLADNLKLTDPLLRLQVYNGLKTITPNTEKGYDGGGDRYGVKIPKEGISMRKRPLYGIRITDLRDNVIKKNPYLTSLIEGVYSR